MARRLPVFLRDDELDRLARATDTERDRVLVLTGLYCGLRVSELTGLEVPDLDFRRRLLRVNRGKGDKDRVVPIPRFLVGPLRGWCGARRQGFVFPGRSGGRLSSRAVQLLLKRLAVKAKLDRATEARRCTPHKLRHGYATMLLDTGASIIEVRDLLGHASVNTTQIYTHANPARHLPSGAGASGGDRYEERAGAGRKGRHGAAGRGRARGDYSRAPGGE